MITELSHDYERWIPSKDRPVELDLGCGKGSFLLQLAERYPERQVIGVDVMIGRLRKVQSKCNRLKVSNVQLLRCGAWPLVCCHLPDHCLDRVHVLCPDPWPKNRHRKNRLLGSEFLGRLSIKLKPGGILHLGTDHKPYFDDMLQAISDMRVFSPKPEAISDVADIQTDFERRFAAQGKPVHHQAWVVC